MGFTFFCVSKLSVSLLKNKLFLPLNCRPIFLGTCLRNILHDLNAKTFVYKINKDHEAYINYRYHPYIDDTWDLHHTYVPREYRGKGIAFNLAKETFEYLQDSNIKVTVSCPFLVKFLEEWPEFQEILREDV